MKKIIICLLSAILISFVGYLFINHYYCAHVECKLSIAMPKLATVQHDVEQMISKSDKNFEVIKKISKLNNLKIDNNGEIIFSLDSQYDVISTPQTTPTGIVWKCKIQPDVDRPIKLLDDCGKLFRSK